jgi:hypothetical protein
LALIKLTEPLLQLLRSTWLLNVHRLRLRLILLLGLKGKLLLLLSCLPPGNNKRVKMLNILNISGRLETLHQDALV